MSRTMVCLEIIGLKSHLQPTLEVLQRLGCVQIDECSSLSHVLAHPLTISSEDLRKQEQVRLLLSQVEGLISTLDHGDQGSQSPQTGPTPSEKSVQQVQTEIDRLLPEVQKLIEARSRCQAELASLPRYEATLNKLAPIVPLAAHQPDNLLEGILVSRSHSEILDVIHKSVFIITEGNAEAATCEIDDAMCAMLLVFPKRFATEVEQLLGREGISRLRLPEQLGTGPPDTAIASLQRRVLEVQGEMQSVEQQLVELAALWQHKLQFWYAYLRDELTMLEMLSRLGETEMTFILEGWTPAHEFERVCQTLKTDLSGAVYIHQQPMTHELAQCAPTLLQNSTLVQPFESLVRLQAVPRYDELDPSRLMALFLPLFFGMMLGDIGYGVVILLLSLGLRQRVKSDTVQDILTVIMMGSVWAIGFGILFGELFGEMGKEVGLHPLLFDRASSEYLVSLLALTIGVGAVHIALGLTLGVWAAMKHRSRSHLLERGGMLIGLIALFWLVSVLAGLLPGAFMTPAIAGIIVGIVLLGASMGRLGLLMGPIEFIGLVGNVLSYLRIAAIGLASVYLAMVANEMAGIVGNLIIGIILAALLHALNIVLGMFSPTIHSLRLHYVEFFRKFYSGGGRPYEPFKSYLR